MRDDSIRMAESDSAGAAASGARLPLRLDSALARFSRDMSRALLHDLVVPGRIRPWCSVDGPG